MLVKLLLLPTSAFPVPVLAAGGSTRLRRDSRFIGPIRARRNSSAPLATKYPGSPNGLYIEELESGAAFRVGDVSLDLCGLLQGVAVGV